MEELEQLLKAAADRTRLRILAALVAYDELCACQLTALIGTSGATVSRHLPLLVLAGLLSSRKEGRWVHFRLRQPSPPPIHSWIEGILADDPILEADRKTLARITATGPASLCLTQQEARRSPG